MFYKLQCIFYRNEKTSLISLFDELTALVRQLPDWREKPDTWLIAHPTETMVAIENDNITEKAYEYVDSMMSRKKFFNIVLADKNKDDSVLTIWLMSTPAVSDNRYYLTLTITSLSAGNNKATFINLIERILGSTPWDFKYIMVDTEQYGMNEKATFDDRLPVGWMLYLPKIIPSSDAVNASEVIYCSNKSGAKSGTIIVSKEVFNGSNQNDINISNNVEIELAAHGHLPLIADL